VQSSATSQTPADARHIVPPATRRSVGQSGDNPVHVSAMSHTPVDARHTVPDAAS
jgi:hypothetical protein